MSNEFKKKNKTKTKSFCSKIVFIHDIGMCEEVGKGSRYESWHVDIHVETYMFYMNVCEFMALHEHLGGE